MGAANPRTGCFRIAATAKKTAGEPWNNEMKQLEASGRCFGPQLRNTTKYPTRYMMQNTGKKTGNQEPLEIRVSITKQDQSRDFRKLEIPRIQKSPGSQKLLETEVKGDVFNQNKIKGISQ